MAFHVDEIMFNLTDRVTPERNPISATSGGAGDRTHLAWFSVAGLLLIMPPPPPPPNPLTPPRIPA